MQNTKSKLWVILFFIIMFAGIGIYMGLNYYANPLGYFTTNQGKDYFYNDDYARSIKAKYILEHKNEIDAVVMGGSKCGAFDPRVLSEYTGLRYYNMYLNIGCFNDYLLYTQFLAEKTSVKEITLHLSSTETEGFDQTGRGNNFVTPASVNGNLWDHATEFLSYLMTDQNTLRSTLSDRPSKSVNSRQTLSLGMKNRLLPARAFLKDPDAYIASRTIKKYIQHIRGLMGQDAAAQTEYRRLNLEAMEKIKNICDENGITLKVVCGPSFLSERFYYECSEYYDYFAELVNIVGEIWDFSDYNEINLNPYNFLNETHYSPAVAHLMLDTMYQKAQREGFGQVLTPENVYDYILKRKNDYNSFRQEYEKTGTVTLTEGLESESFLPWYIYPEWIGKIDLAGADPALYQLGEGALEIEDIELMSEQETA